jgi:hypothetical protein
MKRRYFIIDLPNDNVINALGIRLGGNVSDTYNEDKTKVFIKTTQELIINSGKSFKNIFPPAFTNEYTLEEVRIILKGWGNNTI